ncbi:MAG: PD-(D/E)XK nuclease family protein [Endomicrobium sp.]|nr:PD-(D/E)XK nuclease family protein [Endomicrobium sp.]
MRYDFKISYSRVCVYLFCNYKYKLVYLDNIRTPVNANVVFGHIIHKTLEQFHSLKEMNFNLLVMCYDNFWRDYLLSIDQNRVFNYYNVGRQILENYYKSFKKSRTKILCVEKTFDINIGKYRFVGSIDRIDMHQDGSYEIIDYKTSKKILNSEKTNNDLQLSLYAYACKNVFGFSPNKMSIYFLYKNKKVYLVKSKNEIFDTINIAINVCENILMENFDPSISKCKLCDLKFKCKFFSRNM